MTEATMTARRRPPAFSPRERVRLWLSYQRYALLLTAACVGMIGGLVALGRAWTWGWAGFVIVLPIVVNFGRFSVEVFRAHPRKLRATWAQQRRIDAGRFSPTSIRAYCADPCWRVVAGEVLTRAGLPADERRALIDTFTRELKTDAHATVIVDHVAGTVRRMSATSDTITFFPTPQTQRSPSVLESSTPQRPHLEPGRTS